ncbi:hypothetical protein EI94DRAFT_728666 [Lactarius quietus]|nr:hypothetical protein EI94DRAFT_728666 [Lactarius quietus]
MKTADVPYAADAELPLSFDELQVLRMQYEREVAQSHVTTQTKFNYAWGLVKSPMREHQVEGVQLLAGNPISVCFSLRLSSRTLARYIPPRTPEKTRMPYYLALGHYKMGNYDQAKSFNSRLLEREPTNLQAQSLDGLIETAVNREGYIGMAIAGGAAQLAPFSSQHLSIYRHRLLFILI